MFPRALKARGVATQFLAPASGGHGPIGCKGPMGHAWQNRALKWPASLKLIPEPDAVTVLRAPRRLLRSAACFPSATSL